MTHPRYTNLLEVIEALKAGGDVRGFTFIANDGSERTIGHAQLVQHARARGAKLRALGLAQGDRVALAIPESDEFILTFLGAVSVGLVPVPLYPPLSLGRLDAYLDNMVRILTSAKASLLITTTQVEGVLWSVVPKVPTLRDLLTVSKIDALPEAPFPKAVVKPDDLLFLQFTSGSTALPRGVAVTHASLLANVQAIMEEGLEVNPEVDKGVSWLPLYHDMGLIGFVFAPIVYRLAGVFLPTIAFLKRPTMWFDAVHKHRGTITFAPNFAFARLLKRATDADLERWDLSCIKAIGCGAEPIHGGTMAAFVDRFQKAKLSEHALIAAYGMAEFTLCISLGSIHERVRLDEVDADICYAEKKALAGNGENTLEFVGCGRPFAGHEVGIFDTTTNERLQERQIGEIRVRGPSIAAGYYGNSEATAAAFLPDGWLRTGDLGYLADGEVFITGREKDILIIHGRNYYPQAIEWLVEEVEGIRKSNVVAFSVPGDISEEVVVVAETELNDPAARANVATAVQRHVQEEIGLAVKEVALLGRGEMPKTSSGKLQRRKAREQYLAGTLGAEGVRSLGSTAERLTLARHVLNGFVGKVRTRLSGRNRTGSSKEA
jgi:fatty-acyl-CoA synthase